MGDLLADDIFAALCELPVFDAHTHIEPAAPTARTLDDLLGYHYYTELAHSAGMGHAPLAADFDPKDRCRAIIQFLQKCDNTAQYQWLLEICRNRLGFTGDRIRPEDSDALFDESVRRMALETWTSQVIASTRLERVYLTNNFDDPLAALDAQLYVPCLRTDELVFHLHRTDVRVRLARSAGVEPTDARTTRLAIRSLFERFVASGARACAVSLPPDFEPVRPGSDEIVARGLAAGEASRELSCWVFWMLAECCREFRLPFDLMIGVRRAVYPGGVFQGQDLLDQRMSLVQFAALFNAFPEVKFPVSVLSSGAANQELASFAWIFPNVFAFGHWWYSNIPPTIAADLRNRLHATPRNKLLGYYSDAYKLEFVLPKFNMYRRILAGVLADDFVRPGRYSVQQAAQVGQEILAGNAREVFEPSL